MPSIRFVILHHRQRHGEHWDLMIEQPHALATWQLSLDPLTHHDQPIPATRIADHRKAYLEYEGSISQDRGDVTRIEQGTCDILKVSESFWSVCLYGRRITGVFELSTVRAPSALPRLKIRIPGLQFDSGFFDGELPIDASLVFVADGTRKQEWRNAQ